MDSFVKKESLLLITITESLKEKLPLIKLDSSA